MQAAAAPATRPRTRLARCGIARFAGCWGHCNPALGKIRDKSRANSLRPGLTRYEFLPPSSIRLHFGPFRRAAAEMRSAGLGRTAAISSALRRKRVRSDEALRWRPRAKSAAGTRISRRKRRQNPDRTGRLRQIAAALGRLYGDQPDAAGTGAGARRWHGDRRVRSRSAAISRRCRSIRRYSVAARWRARWSKCGIGAPSFTCFCRWQACSSIYTRR